MIVICTVENNYETHEEEEDKWRLPCSCKSAYNKKRSNNSNTNIGALNFRFEEEVELTLETLLYLLSSFFNLVLALFICIAKKKIESPITLPTMINDRAMTSQFTDLSI